jgi:hypothetical protein
MIKKFTAILSIVSLLIVGTVSASAASQKPKSKQTSAAFDDFNLNSGGQIAQSQGWIYYNPNNSYYKQSYLFKMKTDGSEKQKLVDDNAMSINVSGDWIYYTVTDKQNNARQGIFKVKTDGTERTKISDATASQITVDGDWIFYVDSKADKKTYSMTYYQSLGIKKIKTDGSHETKVYSGSVNDNLHVQKDWIYFTLYVKHTSMLYKIRKDGTGLTKISGKNFESFIIANDWIYYANQKTLYKMSLTGKTNLKLYTSDDYIGQFSLFYHDGWIYFEQGRFGIMGAENIKKVRTDGKQAALYLKNVHPTGLYFANSTFYFSAAWEGNAPLKQLTTNGKVISLEEN